MERVLRPAKPGTRCAGGVAEDAVGAGMRLYNEAILLNAIGTAQIRANNSMKNQKLVKVHQNVLVFKKV